MRRIALLSALTLTAWFGLRLFMGEAESTAQQSTPIKSSSKFSDYYQPPKPAHPPFVHSVVVYLKKDTPPAKVEALVGDCHKILAKIPSVRNLWVGRPSDKSTGNFVVKDYSVSLLLLFDNYEGLKAYEDDPTHVKFVETYLPVVEKLQVYDFLNQTK